MTEERLAGTNLVAKAAADLNENDAKGAVKKIKGLMLLVTANDKKVEDIQKHSTALKKEIAKLADGGGVNASDFAVAE